MPLVLDATVGGPAANSYATRAEANAYHEGHVDEAVWLAATDAHKDRALVMATRLLDAHVSWHGWVASAAQRLAWPRSGLVLPSGYQLPSSTLPDALKNATAELARLLIENPALPDTADTAGIKGLKVGSIAIDFDGTAPTTDVLPESVWLFVRMWGIKLTGRSTGLTVPLVRA